MEELKMYAGQDLDDAYRLMKDYSRRTGKFALLILMIRYYILMIAGIQFT